MGLLEDPLASAHRTRECPALVSEQLGLEQRGRDRRAVEDHEGAGGAGPLLVQRLGEDLFAGPGLALDDHRDGRVREALAQRVEAPHLGAGADQPSEAGAHGQRGRLAGGAAFELQRGGAETDDSHLRAGTPRQSRRRRRRCRWSSRDP